jgi:hypothetical protein
LRNGNRHAITQTESREEKKPRIEGRKKQLRPTEERGTNLTHLRKSKSGLSTAGAGRIRTDCKNLSSPHESAEDHLEGTNRNRMNKRGAGHRILDGQETAQRSKSRASGVDSYRRSIDKDLCFKIFSFQDFSVCIGAINRKRKKRERGDWEGVEDSNNSMR